MKSNIRIVLIHTSHPGNIGAAARAMKNMCLDQLYLVNPRTFPCADASARASGATDILAAAQVVDSLDEAIADCKLVLGASARDRRLSWPCIDAREAGQKLVRESADAPVAILFGREHSGLTNDELDRCHYLLQIPANESYSSLNIAAAVQVIAYEVMMSSLGDCQKADSLGEPLASGEEQERLFEHLQQMLVDVDFLNQENPGLVMRRLRRLFNRTRLARSEVNILRGILTAAQDARSKRS